MEVLLLIVEFVEHYLEIGPGGTAALEESEHAAQEELPPSCHCLLVDGLDFLQQEDALLRTFFLEVYFKQFVFAQSQELARAHELLPHG